MVRELDNIVLTGIIIKTSDVSEYDKRLVILTKERGKIVAFARGARRSKSQFVSVTRVFTFGKFTLYEGKDAYSLVKADIENYFTEISNDMEVMCYGCYFLEFADYLSKENIESTELLKLVYQTLRALLNGRIPNRLVKCIFELKCMVINGEYPQVFECIFCKSKELKYFSVTRGGMLCPGCVGKVNDATEVQTSTLYAMQFIISTPVEKLYTFVLKDEILSELEFIMRKYIRRYVDREFKSLNILNYMIT